MDPLLHRKKKSKLDGKGVKILADYGEFKRSSLFLLQILLTQMQMAPSLTHKLAKRTL